MELGSFAEFGIIILLASALGILATKLKQPPILGYIVTGLIIGPLTRFLGHDIETIDLLAQVGITFLLFTLGLELNFADLKRVGKVAISIGLGQIIFTSIVGYVIALLIGFNPVESLYIAIGLTFSSTIVIIKLLSSNNQLETLFGKVTVGFLLVQDFVAIAILIVLSAVKNIQGADYLMISASLLWTLGKGLVLIAGVFLFVKFILNPILNSLKMEKEVMFLTVLAWALVLAALFGSEFIGFTIEIGGLIAGIALSNRFEQLQIESWTRPLRDFFLTLFFVLLGFNIQPGSLEIAILPAIIFSVFILVLNPVIVMVIMGFMGYTKRTSFLTSLSVAQISEFSLILINFAYRDLGVVDNVTLTIMTLVGGITMSISSYLIYYNEAIYDKLKNYLTIFEFKKFLDQSREEDLISTEKEIVLFGCHRMGKNILKMMPHEKENLLIIDYDPRNVSALKMEGYKVIYADMSDDEMYRHFHLEKAKVVISTVPSLKDNKTLLRYISKFKEKPLMVSTANDDDGAKVLYDLGADFVIYPHLISSELISDIIQNRILTKNIVDRRTKHMESISLLK